MKKRNANVDLLRIIATLLVVLLHVLGKGGILKNASPEGSVYWVAWLLETGAYCAVNCFALISGYVMMDKKIKATNLLGLWMQIIFYSLLLSGLFFAFVPESRTLQNFVPTVLPILGNQWWYTSQYFALFCFMPFLNKAIQSISQHTYRKFLIVVFLAVCCASCIIPIDAFALNDGYSPAWLMIGYLLGAYIKKYQLQKKITAAKSILGFSAMILLAFASKLAIHFATKLIFGAAQFDGTFISYPSILIILASIFLLLFCLNIKLSVFSEKVIRFFAPATLGVFLLHSHPLVVRYLLADSLLPLINRSPLVMVVGVTAATLAIFVLCSGLDWLRIQLFKLLRVDKLCEFIHHKFTELYLKIFKDQK